MIAQTLGGVGLFLVGMVLVTDGLRAAAGDALRRVLLRFTGGPLKALVSGAAVTALVQSSSATTVATIGFVGAGLLTFEQALGLILGANIGTTATGWFVALLGLKFSVSTVALPLVGVGALLRLFTRGRAAHLALAAAGFGIIFVGIDVLQVGMEELSERLTPAELPGDSWGGRLKLLGVGVLMTTVMQSSSAAVATALAALHSGTISIHQAAAMAIGINIGTTVTAGFAALGASTAAKRTAVAHLLFNLLTGLVAFATLPTFVWAIGQLGARLAPGDATVLLAAFHTAFNLVGVGLVLPFARPFAAMVVRVVPHRGPHLTRLLDPSAAGQGTLATEAVRQTVIEILRAVLSVVEDALGRKKLTVADTEQLDAASSALRETEEYVAALRFATPLSEAGHQRHVSTIHALDHLGRAIDVAMELPGEESPGDVALQARQAGAIAAMRAWAGDSAQPAPVETLHHLVDALRAARQALRDELLTRVAAGETSPAMAGRQLDHLRWREELAYHLWRLADRLRGERMLESDTAA